MDEELFGELLLYYGLDDFYNNRKLIKRVFTKKDNRTQYLYRMYVYSRPFIKDNWKDYIWDYLQNDIKESEFITLYFQHKRKHQAI